MADTPTGETVTPEAPSNGPSTTTAPVTDNSSASVEAAKKEAEQARMRANQVENEKKALEERLAEIERNKLAEKEEFKTLADSLASELTELKTAQAEKERSDALQSATQSVLNEYPEKVVALAKTAGLSLLDDSEAAIADLKAKLDVFKKEVSPASTATPNNPHNPVPANADKAELVARMRGDNVEVTRAAINQYVHNHPAVQKMREIANGL